MNSSAQFNNRTAFLLCVGGLIGLLVGYVSSEDATTIDRLNREVSQLRADLNKLARSPASAPKNRPRPVVAPLSNVRPLDKSTEEMQQATPAQMQTEIHQRGLKEWVRKTAIERSTEYSAIFSNFGLNPENAEIFKAKLTDLHQKAIDAGEPLMGLLKARNAYDKEIRSALGEENYRRYRSFEERKPATREYNLLSEFAITSKGTTLDAAYSETLIQYIKDSNATTTETWHDPYDPLPRPTAGKEMTIGRINQDLELLKRKSGQLIGALEQATIPEQYLNIVRDYYANAILQKEQELVLFSRPPRDILRELRSTMTKRPN